MRTFHGEPGNLQLQKLLTAAEIAAPDNAADRTIHLAISGNRLVSILNALDSAMHATGRYELVGNDTVACAPFYAELRAVTEAVRDELSRQRCNRDSPGYLVTWQVDSEEPSPRDAAIAALAMMRNPESIATVFDVTDKRTTRVTRVDLSDSAYAEDEAQAGIYEPREG